MIIGKRCIIALDFQVDTVYADFRFFVDNSVDSVIFDELEAAGEVDDCIDSVCSDEDTSEEEREETLAQMKEAPADAVKCLSGLLIFTLLIMYNISTIILYRGLQERSL